MLDICRRFCKEDGIWETPVPCLTLYRSSDSRHPTCVVATPALGLVLQGSKEVLLGGSKWTYGARDFLLVSADLPLKSYSVDASTDRPYIGLAVSLEPSLIAEVAAEAKIPLERAAEEVPALGVERLHPNLEEVVTRLVGLIERPGDASMLGPLMQRELIYLLLKGPSASALHRLALGESASCALSAVRWLRENFDQELRIEDLAHELNVSVSGLHHQFKALTCTSPLQYQKLLRLQEARRLLLGGELGAAEAGFKVGYGSSSQFSREYKRLFGAPPMTDREKVLPSRR